MALDKNKLRAKMQANSPSQTPTLAVPLTDLAGAKPNARTPEQPSGLDNLIRPTTPLKGIARRKRAKDGIKNTSRYSFEITAELKAQLERAVLQHQLDTGKKVSTSSVIRTAIEKYLKTGKL
jgi:hypothetical protein